MTDREAQPQAGKNELRRSGIAVLFGALVGPAIQAVLLFGTAGRTDLPRVWLFLGLTLVSMLANTVLVAAVNPELLNQRGLWRTKKDAKPWDRKLLAIFGIFSFYLPPIVMGLDVGRYGWSDLGPWATVLGSLLFVLGWSVITWAMLANTHFEVMVRIQTDRDHKVVSTGPYRIVRHPGYAGASLWALGGPLVVGSAYGLIPSVLTILILIVRTRREDRTLQAELPGYADYARKTRYRLIPRVW